MLDVVYDELYIRFLYEFNQTRDFFECHEVMEQLWLENGRNLVLQGLLQIAVGLYHHHNGNPNGAIKLLSAGLEKLSNPLVSPLGIDVDKFLADSEAYLQNIKSKITTPYYFDIVIIDGQLQCLLAEQGASEHHQLDESPEG